MECTGGCTSGWQPGGLLTLFVVGLIAGFVGSAHAQLNENSAPVPLIPARAFSEQTTPDSAIPVRPAVVTSSAGLSDVSRHSTAATAEAQRQNAPAAKPAPQSTEHIDRTESSSSLPSALERPGLPEEAPEPSDTFNSGTLILSLEHCLELALGGNLDISLGRLAPKDRAEDRYIAGEVFQPSGILTAALEDSEQETNSELAGAPVFKSKLQRTEFLARKKWKLGTQSNLQFEFLRDEDNSEFRNINPSRQARVYLEVEQPLFQGFGLAVNKAELNRAINDRKIAEADFEMLLESELLSVYRSYWDLIRAGADLELQQASLQLAEDQAALTRDQLEAGVVPSLELVSAEAALARQQERVIFAESAYRKSSDQLLQQIRPAANLQDFELALVPTTLPVLDGVLPPVPDPEQAAAAAVAQRPELKAEEFRRSSAELDALIARNRVHPNINLFGRYGYNSLSDESTEAVNELTGQDFPEWQAGIRFSFFFHNPSRQARWRQTLLRQESADLRYQRALSLVIQEVRAALLDLETAHKQLLATRRTLDLAREQYAGEKDRLAVGRSTVFRTDLLRRDLLEAERNQLNAQIGVYLSRAILEAAQGQFAKRIVATINP